MLSYNNLSVSYEDLGLLNSYVAGVQNTVFHYISVNLESLRAETNEELVLSIKKRNDHILINYHLSTQSADPIIETVNWQSLSKSPHSDFLTFIF